MKTPRISTISDKVEAKVQQIKDTGRWRDLAAYWIIGLCNNYGYVVMLSAAHDIIERFSPEESDTNNPRNCNIVSTGAILLADILPCLIVKSLVAFLPLFMNVRVFLACLLQCGGFLLVAFADSKLMAYSGVALMSASSGLGEASMLAYSSQYNKSVISAWSSGTGGAGILGSFSYAALTMMGVTPKNAMLIMLTIPFLEAAAFWILLRGPTISKKSSEASFDLSLDEDDEKFTLSDKIRYMPSLILYYMMPLGGVYLFEYFINQGLFELIDFQNIWLSKHDQYRWLQVDYQIGVFISRSSANFFQIDKIWLMSIFQFVNIVLLLTEVITFVSPCIWIVFFIVLWEGLLGGAAYVNTYYKMTREVPAHRMKFALSIVSISDAIGIALAGAIAIPAHDALCQLPLPQRA